MANYTTPVSAVHVWYDQGMYSVSLIDADGEEIRCVGGDSDMEVAWAIGEDKAESFGVPCVLYRDESGQPSRKTNFPPVEHDDDYGY